ncbi:MAG: hypothetical protein ACOH5I_26240 [Oligoflexus sp.]
MVVSPKIESRLCELERQNLWSFLRSTDFGLCVLACLLVLFHAVPIFLGKGFRIDVIVNLSLVYIGVSLVLMSIVYAGHRHRFFKKEIIRLNQEVERLHQDLERIVLHQPNFVQIRMDKGTLLPLKRKA